MRGTRKSIWHDAKEEPEKDDSLLIEKMWDDYVYFNDLIRWCYISDLEKLIN